MLMSGDVVIFTRVCLQCASPAPRPPAELSSGGSQRINSATPATAWLVLGYTGLYWVILGLAPTQTLDLEA